MSLKKILFCASTASHITNFHMPYLEQFKKQGYEVHTIANKTISSPFVDCSYEAVFDKHNLSFQNILSVFQIAKRIKQERYSVISSHATLAGAILRLAVLISGDKEVVVIHTSHGYLFKSILGFKDMLYLLVEKILKICTDLLITMNQEDFEIAKKHRLCKKIKFIDGCGLISEKFPNLSEAEITKIKEEYGINQNQRVILCVGEFSKRKNQEFLIQGFVAVVARNPNVMILFAGEGVLQAHCQLLVNGLSLAKRILFCGYVQRINNLYRVADIVVSTSLSEGLPFNIMEALNCHIPVVASRVKGHTDLLVDGVNGLIFDVDDGESLTSCLQKLLENTAVYEQIKSNSVLKRKYYIEDVKPQMMELYNKVINCKRE
ncbi:MAG: glycosyltransferase [Oscillospiraceae bacterium]